MSSSSDALAFEDEYGLPAGLSNEEAAAYINGLTQTCAALRCRIAELEKENRNLRKAGSSKSPIDPAPPQGSAGAGAAAAECDGGWGLLGGGAIMPQDMMALMSPPAGVAAGRGRGGGERRAEEGFKSEGAARRLSWMGTGGTTWRRATANRDSDASDGPAAARVVEGAGRRVSSVPVRARYSVGVSRFSLPSSLSPGPPTKTFSGANKRGTAAIYALDEAGSGGVWEGLMLTHPLTGDDKKLTFMEFAVVGVGTSTLAGSHPLRPWGQDPEVLSGFPAPKWKSAGEAERGKGDGSFVQGLGEFCFPSGIKIALVESGAAGTPDAVPDDRTHLVQFTDCENASTYGCCLTVTQILQDPSPRLVKRLRARERMHAAATTLQRFMRFACCLTTAGRRLWGGDAGGYRCETRTTGRGVGGGASRFGFQTPTPGSAAIADTLPAASAENSPASTFSGMISRFFASNPGAGDVGTPAADAVGEGRRGVKPAPPAAAAPHSAARTSTGAVAGAVIASAASSPARSMVSTSGAATAVAAATAAASAASSVSPREAAGVPSSLSPMRRRVPSSPCPKTRVSIGCTTTSTGGRAMSAGYGDGGNSQGILRECGNQSQAAGEERNIPGMFSDDESESDAGCSTDRDGSFGGDANGTLSIASVTVATSDQLQRRDARGRRRRQDGEPAKSGAHVKGVLGTPRGLTLRKRTANPHAGAAAAAEVAVDAAIRTGGETSVVATGGGTRLSVLVERCYVMISCHRNHPLMFKVLKAIADAERSSSRPLRRRGTSPSPASPPAVTGAAGCTGRAGPGSSLSPPRVRPAVGRSEANCSYDDGVKAKEGRSLSAGRLMSVAAAAAAEEAKGRHRRILRDKFLQQVRADKSCTCTEEVKKVSLHCPAYLRAPLELTPAPLELWSTAVLFGRVSEEAMLQALDVLLLEKTLAVCGRDLGMVSIVATALLSLLDPFEWEGVFVPVVPATLMDVLDSPVPALVGVQAPFDPLKYAVDRGLAVFDLDARQSSGRLFLAGVDDMLPPVCENLVRALKAANTFSDGRGRDAGASEARRSPMRTREGAHTDSTGSKAGSPMRSRGGVGRWGGLVSPSSTATSPLGPRSHFAFQASTFLAGLTSVEKGTVIRLRSLVKGHISSLCGDLGVTDKWRKYGAVNAVTKNFDFDPDRFTGPMEARLRFQVSVARTQMFVAFVERCRQMDFILQKSSGDEVCSPQRGLR